jgi:Xaa-Pro aminopeptidase
MAKSCCATSCSQIAEERLMSEFSQRLAAARRRLAEEGLDGMLLTPGPDLRYLTGFEVYAGERLVALLLPREGEARFLVPEMNVAQATGNEAGVSAVRGWTDAEGYVEPLGAACRELGWNGGHLAADDEMRAAFLLDWQSVCPRAQFQKASRVLQPLRIQKGKEELAALRRAGQVADGVIAAAHAACVPGATEAEVARTVTAAMHDLEPACQVYGCIVASGPNSALPHHETGGRPLQDGDVVILDYGCELEGYHSDITLTVSLGPADEEARRIHEVVWEAQQRALEAIRPGVAAEAIDAAARRVITAAGYGDYFIHRTGHGIGLQVHEPPYLVAGNRVPLEEGMTVSVEPGIYLPGRFGVRLEVIVAVGAAGAELLNLPSPRRLVELIR